MRCTLWLSRGARYRSRENINYRQNTRRFVFYLAHIQCLFTAAAITVWPTSSLFYCFRAGSISGTSTENRMKKLVCHSFTTKRINNEWIEIEARQVIKHWLKAHRMNHNRGIVTDPVVMIDVEDEFQQPLKAGLFFEPTDCQTCMRTITISTLVCSFKHIFFHNNDAHLLFPLA